MQQALQPSIKMQTAMPIWSLETWQKQTTLWNSRWQRNHSRPNVSSSQFWQWKTEQRGKVVSLPPQLSLWHSERYLPCKDLDISRRALITSWNMNKSAESGEEPRRAFVNRYWLILLGGRKEGAGTLGGPRGATLYWSSVNLVKRFRPLPRTGWGHPRWSSQSLWFPDQSKNPG